jgi:5S rRNA maturation endonuclease (ribonuclease M5)|tara:strand:+ start:494 stop:1366 length:873 start_codon:yes stop_codon:yes gene_type:complete
MNFLVNPNLFINRYLKGTKVTETFNQYRLGNKGSKCILKDGSGYFDHELGNHTSLFNEVMNREGLSTSQTIQFCKDNHMLLNQNEMVEVSNTQSKYKIDRLKSLEDNLIPFGFTKAHEYLLKRGILETAIPENVIFFESIKNLLCHKITNINDEVIGYQTFKIDSNINKVKPPKIYGSCKGGKTPISITKSQELILVEGLEDGLTIHQSYQSKKIKKNIWVMIGTSNFMNVEIPWGIRKVILALDNDNAGQTVFEKAKDRFGRMNLGVSRIKPSPDYKDFNDELRGIKKQ